MVLQANPRQFPALGFLAFPRLQLAFPSYQRGLPGEAGERTSCKSNPKLQLNTQEIPAILHVLYKARSGARGGDGRAESNPGSSPGSSASLRVYVRSVYIVY
jgi:hypothetical protein